MDVLASRILLRPTDLDRAQRFYRDVLGLAAYREQEPGSANLSLWLQVRDVHSEYHRLTAQGVPIVQSPRLEPWGLLEMWISDPDGVRIVLVQVPDDHPLRRDPRNARD
jgi:predicted enzyme related to lactoylglutathione lyase